MAISFIHLRTHSEFSICDGLADPKELPCRAASLGMPAIALTDYGNCFAAFKFYGAALRAGIKPILGCDLRLAVGTEQKTALVTLLACDSPGRKNLFQIISRLWTQGIWSDGQPVARREWFNAKSCGGLIALSGGMQGEIGQELLAGRKDRAARSLDAWSQWFPGAFYLEIQRIGRPGEEEYLQAALELGAEHGIPPVASNEVCFLDAEQYEAHEARVCINSRKTLEDTGRVRLHTEKQYLRSMQQMAELFADIPAALQNSVEIAKRCNLEINLKADAAMPLYPEIKAEETEMQLLRRMAKKGLRERFAESVPGPEYQKRLDDELDVIKNTGFPGYFLIVMDIVNWARKQGIPVGPGRGSGAGSVVAWVLGITGLDPLQYGLLFERFLNPERVSMPDFDIDFCQERRDEVIEYVKQRYGTDRVTHIVTFNHMEARAVVRDVARVLNKPYSLGDRIARLIPGSLGITLDKAREEKEDLHELLAKDAAAREVWELAQKLESRVRSAGRHAGGVVIAPSQLEDFAPLYCDAPDGALSLQLDKDDVARAGLVKFDLLGLRTLTVIEYAQRAINAQRSPGQAPLQISALPLNDTKTFHLLSTGFTTAVFQLESPGMRDLLRRYEPAVFDDIIALVALYRPGPLREKMHIDFVERKHGRKSVDYPLPQLKPILENTRGIFLYQEQVMESARVLAGYSRGKADLLRRAMGKKDSVEMASHRKIFLAGAKQNGIEEFPANKVFNSMEAFSEYGFNRSHATVYALLAYQTAWLKCHHRAHFMAAEMSTVADNTDRLALLLIECRRLCIEVYPPDINCGDVHFHSEDGQSIRYGLAAIKGVGHGAAEAIVKEREAGGIFHNLFDFCARIKSSRIGHLPALQALIRAGAMDGLHRERWDLLAMLPRAVQFAEQSEREHSSGMQDFFGGVQPVAEEEKVESSVYTAVCSWSQNRFLREEYAALGLYLKAHPADIFREQLLKGGKPLKDCQLGSISVVALFVEMRRVRGGFFLVELEDGSGRLEMLLSAEMHAAYQGILSKSKILYVVGEIEKDKFGAGALRLRAQKIHLAESLYYRDFCGVELRLNAQLCSPRNLEQIATLLRDHQGGDFHIQVVYRNHIGEGVFHLPEQWNIYPSEELLLQFQHQFGSDRIRYISADMRGNVLPPTAHSL